MFLRLAPLQRAIIRTAVRRQGGTKPVTSSQQNQERSQLRHVRGWLALVAIMIAAMVIVGGATRLTESGLSIVEWKPVSGTLPPLTEPQWSAAFDAYRAIPQYRELNN